MSYYWSEMVSFFKEVGSVILSFRFADLLDILLVAFIIYHIINLIRETRAALLFKGLLLVGVAYVIIYCLNMQASKFIFQKLLVNIILVLVVLFQPEIRHALESVGRSNISLANIFNRNDEQPDNSEIKKSIIEIVRACVDMSGKKIGALIVFERETPLGEIINTGTEIDATVSRELIGNIFYPKSPLHDGAAIIRAGKLKAASCILPLTGNNSISSDLGTRHRAAIGISEESDAIILVVSEETGDISIAQSGKLERNVSDGVIMERLAEALVQTDTSDEKKGVFSKLFGRGSR